MKKSTIPRTAETFFPRLCGMLFFLLLASDSWLLTPAFGQSISVTTPIRTLPTTLTTPQFQIQPAPTQTADEMQWKNAAGAVVTWVDKDGVLHFPGGGGGISNINGLTASTQYFIVCNLGLDFNIQDSIDTHSLCIPDASATARGLVTTGAQVIGGPKTFPDSTLIDDDLYVTGNFSTDNPIETTCSTPIASEANVGLMGCDIATGSYWFSVDGSTPSGFFPRLDQVLSAGANALFANTSFTTSITGTLNSASPFFSVDTESTTVSKAGFFLGYNTATGGTNVSISTSDPTNVIGLELIPNTGISQPTNYYGLFIDDVSAFGSVGNYAIYTGQGTVHHGGTTDAPIFNATTGFQLGGAGTSGRYLKGDGTNFVISSGSASGVGACGANTYASTLNSDAAPTCTQPVTSFSAGTLSPLFTTSVATATTTPALSFTLSNAAAFTLFANNTGGAAAPSHTTFDSVFGSCSAGTSALTFNTTTHAFGCNTLVSTSKWNALTAPDGNLSFSVGSFTSTFSGTGAFSFPRIKSSGTALVSGDFTPTGWGAGAAVGTVSGTDQWFQFTVTAGTVPSLSPTVALTYKDGTWTTAPIPICNINGGTGAISFTPATSTATVLTLTYVGTPVNALTYIIACHVGGI